MKKIQLTLLVLFFVLGAFAQDCATIPVHFPSYDAAMLFVRKADWKYKDEISIYKSSWLTHAEYYSCDRHTGIFIFRTNRGYEYIMKGMPVSVWDEFKNANDYGVYYNKNIRGKYHFPL